MTESIINWINNDAALIAANANSVAVNTTLMQVLAYSLVACIVGVSIALIVFLMNN